MKNNLIFYLMMFISLWGCKKLDKLTHFTLKYNETIIIPSSFGINLPVNIFTPDIESNSESEFKINNTRKDLIEEINLTSLKLIISSPSNADFGFLQSVNLYLNAEELPETKIAWKNEIPDDIGNELELEVTGDD